MKNIKIILFQILYTISCFNDISLRHNDLHFNNIFVDTLDSQLINVYWISEMEYFCVER